MSVVVNSPYESKYGFKSPGFVVDKDGNVIVKTLIQSDANVDGDVLGLPVDYAVTLSENGDAYIINDDIDQPTPDIELQRNGQFVFSLSLTKSVTRLELDEFGNSVVEVVTLPLYFYEEDQTTLYSAGLIHSDGSTEADALGKTSGTLVFRVPVGAPDLLFYGNADAEILGRITISDPLGSFGVIQANATTQSTSILTGALKVSGGAGIAKNLWVGGTLNAAALNVNGVGIPVLSSSTNLELIAGNRIVIKVDNVLVGEINSSGSSIAINNSTIENTTIGVVTPSTATFTTASITEVPLSAANVTSKSYVDQTATALAIAFGL